MKDYYEIPTQVVFSDSEGDGVKELIGGIAYKENIICGECGGIIELEEIEEGNLKELPWVNVDPLIDTELSRKLRSEEVFALEYKPCLVSFKRRPDSEEIRGGVPFEEHVIELETGIAWLIENVEIIKYYSWCYELDDLIRGEETL